MLSKLPPKGEEDLSLAWSAAAWLESLRARIPKNAASNAKPGEANSQDEQLKADSMDTETGRLGLIVDALARSLLKHAPAQYELEGELDRMRRLAHVDRDTLRECLTAACVELTDSLLSELKALGDNAEGTSAEENKFAGLVPLRFAGLDVFYGGLESLVGAPEPNFQTEGGAKQEWQFQRAMEYEHIHGTDCKREFTTGNYGITTTSEKEWQFVVARNQELPVEGLQCSHPRNFVLLAELEEQMAKHNTRLKGLGQTEMIRAELVGGRLYTGPVFTKYNVVLRALQVEDNELRKRFLTLCGLEGSAEHYDQIALRVNPVPGAVAGQPSSCAQAWERAAEGANKYTTTLHAINSCIIKTSKLTAATKVYRGISDMALPREFLQPNEFGVRGGVEAAFMSTTTDRSVAIGYAGKSDAGVVFEVQMGMIDRGANIGWLSQYPHEKEILFGPLSGLEVVAVRTSGMLVVVEAKLSVNLSALTLEQVVAKRQKVVRDMCLQLELGVEHGIAKDAGGAWTKFFESSALNKRRTLEFLRSWLCSHQDLEAEYYNDDASLGHVIEETVHAAKCVAAWPSKFAHLPLEWKAPLGEGKAMGSDKRHQAQEGDDFVLAIDQRAHSCVEGVAALLLARDGPRTLEVKDAALSVPEVVTVVEAVHHSSSRSSLKRLVLSGNHCDVRGARALARLLQKTTAIRELELDNAKLTFRRNYSGFQEFCAVLGVNTILRLLSLSGNEMGDQGAQHLASALEKNRTLTTINLNNNKVGAEGAQHLGSALEKNRTLATLNLSSNKMGAEGAQRMALAIEKNGTLMTLDLNRNGTGDKGAQHLASALEKNRTLTTLDLSDNNIGAEGAQHLASVVEKNGTLTTINLSGNEMGDQGALHLAYALEKNATLMTLNLGDNEIGDKGAQHLAFALEKNRTLTTLNLRMNCICNKGTQLLASALEKNGTLTTLKLNRNTMGAEGAQHLASALEKNMTLTTLDLSDHEIGDKVAQHLASALKKNGTLTTLNLRANEIGAEGARHLASALEKNRTLMTLDLNRNGMGAEGVQHLASALEKNATLTTLDLSENAIGRKGAQHLAPALEKNGTLTTLDLSGNDMFDEGAQHLASALEKNWTLTKLNLRMNWIGDKGAQHLASAIKKNGTLTTLKGAPLI